MKSVYLRLPFIIVTIVTIIFSSCEEQIEPTNQGEKIPIAENLTINGSCPVFQTMEDYLTAPDSVTNITDKTNKIYFSNKIDPISQSKYTQEYWSPWCYSEDGNRKIMIGVEMGSKYYTHWYPTFYYYHVVTVYYLKKTVLGSWRYIIEDMYVDGNWEINAFVSNETLSGSYYNHFDISYSRFMCDPSTGQGYAIPADALYLHKTENLLTWQPDTPDMINNMDGFYAPTFNRFYWRAKGYQNGTRVCEAILSLNN